MKPPASRPGRRRARAARPPTACPSRVGRACMCTASQDTPTNIAIAITPSTASARAAFAAVPPPEGVHTVRDRLHAGEGGRPRMRKRAAGTNSGYAAGAGGDRVGNAAWGHPAEAQRPMPVPTSSEDRRNERVRGQREATCRPLARRAGSRARSARRTRARGPARARAEPVTAEVSASTPAATTPRPPARSRSAARPPRRGSALAEFLLRDDVGAAPRLVDPHRLAVRERDDRQQPAIAERDRKRQTRGADRRPDAGRRARPPSRTPPSTAGQTRRSAARSTSAAASPPSGSDAIARPTTQRWRRGRSCSTVTSRGARARSAPALRLPAVRGRPGRGRRAGCRSR